MRIPSGAGFHITPRAALAPQYEFGASGATSSIVTVWMHLAPGSDTIAAGAVRRRHLGLMNGTLAPTPASPNRKRVVPTDEEQ